MQIFDFSDTIDVMIFHFTKTRLIYPQLYRNKKKKRKETTIAIVCTTQVYLTVLPYRPTKTSTTRPASYQTTWRINK